MVRCMLWVALMLPALLFQRKAILHLHLYLYLCLLYHFLECVENLLPKPVCYYLLDMPPSLLCAVRSRDTTGPLPVLPARQLQQNGGRHLARPATWQRAHLRLPPGPAAFPRKPRQGPFEAHSILPCWPMTTMPFTYCDTNLQDMHKDPHVLYLYFMQQQGWQGWPFNTLCNAQRAS